jgi:hypothetical protein
MNICTCGYCGEGGHSLSKCPELRTPLKEGFTSERGGDDLDGDDDSQSLSLRIGDYDDSISLHILLQYIQQYHKNLMYCVP